jgi:hypothetical protein
MKNNSTALWLIVWKIIPTGYNVFDFTCKFYTKDTKKSIFANDDDIALDTVMTGLQKFNQ